MGDNVNPPPPIQHNEGPHPSHFQMQGASSTLFHENVDGFAFQQHGFSTASPFQSQPSTPSHGTGSPMLSLPQGGHLSQPTGAFAGMQMNSGGYAAGQKRPFPSNMSQHGPIANPFTTQPMPLIDNRAPGPLVAMQNGTRVDLFYVINCLNMRLEEQVKAHLSTLEQLNTMKAQLDHIFPNWESLLAKVASVMSSPTDDETTAPAAKRQRTSPSTKTPKVRNTDLELAVQNGWTARIGCDIERESDGGTGRGKLSKILPKPGDTERYDANDRKYDTPDFTLSNGKKQKVNTDIFKNVVKHVQDNDAEIKEKYDARTIYNAVATRFVSLQKAYKQQNDPEAMMKHEESNIRTRKTGRTKEKLERRTAALPGFLLKNEAIVPRTITPTMLKPFFVKEAVSSEDSDVGEGDNRQKVLVVKPKKFRATWLARLMLSVDRYSFQEGKVGQMITRRRLTLEQASGRETREAPNYLPPSFYNRRWLLDLSEGHHKKTGLHIWTKDAKWKEFDKLVGPNGPIYRTVDDNQQVLCPKCEEFQIMRCCPAGKGKDRDAWVQAEEDNAIVLLSKAKSPEGCEHRNRASSNLCPSTEHLSRASAASQSSSQPIHDDGTDRNPDETPTIAKAPAPTPSLLPTGDPALSSRPKPWQELARLASSCQPAVPNDYLAGFEGPANSQDNLGVTATHFRSKNAK
ncbi:hypothetical protein NMY22_g782 [Coprinellus aureogranulatus]|nr:hypothetical protein NMY22_g782 [Coprinellus aureogranulatus]